MPEIKITTTVKCLFRNESHLQTIIETAKEGNAQVLTNVLLLQPSGTKAPPVVKMVVERIGRDDEEIDIVKYLMDRAGALVSNEEDPFA